MSPETALQKLRALAEPGGDIEAKHGEADEILCELLRSFGYIEIVDAYNAIEKWYA